MSSRQGWDRDNNTPVIFIIFNRLDTAKQVFEAIKAARPKTLLVIADGPRPDRPGEADKCEATRAIIHEVDWECDVHTNFSSVNMGLCQRISSGITWAFEIVDKAIILEDDCVPDPSFFHFCADILERYEADERVMMISGNNHLFGRTGTADSYYFQIPTRMGLGHLAARVGEVRPRYVALAGDPG